MQNDFSLLKCTKLENNNKDEYIIQIEVINGLTKTIQKKELNKLQLTTSLWMVTQWLYNHCNFHYKQTEKSYYDSKNELISYIIREVTK